MTPLEIKRPFICKCNFVDCVCLSEKEKLIYDIYRRKGF